MDVRVSGNILGVRLYAGEDVVSSIEQAVKSTGKPLGIVLSGAGMMKCVRLGYFMGKGEYKENTVDTPAEIVSLTGNFINSKDGFFTHLHVSLANDDGKVVGGHLHKAGIHSTGEVFIYLTEIEATRRLEEETGLKGLIL